MKKTSFFGLGLFLLPHLCFAGLVNLTVDFWDSAPYVFDGHIVLPGVTDANGLITEVSLGTIEIGGRISDFSPTRFGFNDQGNDRFTGGFDGEYVDSQGATHSAWAHFEGSISELLATGNFWGAESFIYADYSPSSAPPKWSAARVRVVDVPEPSGYILSMLGLAAVWLTRTHRRRSSTRKFS